jgi:hypothetical protein
MQTAWRATSEACDQLDGSSLGKTRTSFVPQLSSIRLHGEQQAKPATSTTTSTERNLDFDDCGHLIPCRRLTKIHLRLAGNIDYSFLQIPHWD